MKKKISLAKYVRRLNGVPLGASGSLSNMLYRSFGASSFAMFWHYWNPIWSYYLGYCFYRPLTKYAVPWLAVVLTFTISGALHDLAVMVLTMSPFFFCTPWFMLMGVLVVGLDARKVDYSVFAWPLRAMINLTFVVSTLGTVKLLEWAFG